MPPARTTQVAGPSKLPVSKLPVIKMRPRPPRAKKAPVKTQPVVVAPPPPEPEPEPTPADSGLFTPPEDSAFDDIQNKMPSYQSEDTLRFPMRPSLAFRLASEEAPFSLGSDSTFGGGTPVQRSDTHKRKRNTSTVSPVLEPPPLPASFETTPNPKPRKQVRRQSRTRSLSPTRALSARNDDDDDNDDDNEGNSSPTTPTPKRSARESHASYAVNPVAGYLPSVPASAARKVNAAHSMRRSATPVAYEPPRERFTSPEVVLLQVPPSASKPRRSPRSGSKLTLQIKREAPEIDLSVPPAPPSPSEDPLLLHYESPLPAHSPAPQTRPPTTRRSTFGRSTSRSPMPSPMSSVARDVPRFLSDSPPPEQPVRTTPAPGTRSNASSPPDELPVPAPPPQPQARDNGRKADDGDDDDENDSLGPPSSDSESDVPAFNFFSGPARKAAEAEDALHPGGGDHMWSDHQVYPQSSPLAKGKPEGEGEDEYTGRFMLVAVPTKNDPPTMEEKERMDKWGRPVSPFPGSPVVRRHSWLEELEGEVAKAQETGEEEGEGENERERGGTTPLRATPRKDSRFDFALAPSPPVGQSTPGRDARFDFASLPSPSPVQGTPSRDTRVDFASVPSPVSFPRRSAARPSIREEPQQDELPTPEDAYHSEHDDSHDTHEDDLHAASTHLDDSLSTSEHHISHTDDSFASSGDPHRSVNTNADEQDDSHEQDENLGEASFLSYDEPLRDPEAEASVELEHPSGESVDALDFAPRTSKSPSRLRQSMSVELPTRTSVLGEADASLEPPDDQEEDVDSAEDEDESRELAEISRRYSLVAPSVEREQGARESVVDADARASKSLSPAPWTRQSMSVERPLRPEMERSYLQSTPARPRASNPSLRARQSMSVEPPVHVSEGRQMDASNESLNQETEEEDSGDDGDDSMMLADISRRYSIVNPEIRRVESEPAAEKSIRLDEFEDEEMEDRHDGEDVLGRQFRESESPRRDEDEVLERSVEEEEEEYVQDSLYVDRALSQEPQLEEEEERLVSPVRPTRRSTSRASMSYRPQSDNEEEERPISPARPTRRSTSRVSRVSVARRGSTVSLSPQPEPQSGLPRGNFSFDEEMYAPEPSTSVAPALVPVRRSLQPDRSVVMADPEDEELAKEQAVSAGKFLNHDALAQLGGDEDMQATRFEYQSTDTESEEEVDPNLVTITSEDPKAAARAAAILKMYDYDCLPQVLARRRRDSHATLDALLRSSNRKSVSAGGVSKLGRSHSVGGVLGDRVYIPGSPMMTLPQLLNQAEVELENDPSVIERERSILENSPVKGQLTLPESRATSVGLPDAPMRASSNPLMTPNREPVQLPPEFLQDTPAYPTQAKDNKEWGKEEWKAMDTCFTDERLDTAHRLGLPEGELADVDEVNLEDVVDRFTNMLFGGSAGWDRAMLLTRARVLAKKQRSGNIAPPTPNGSRQSSVAPFPGMHSVDITPMSRALERRQSMTLGEKGKIPATLLAPRYSYLMDEAIALNNEYDAALAHDRTASTSVDVGPSEAQGQRKTPPRELTTMEPPPTIGRRVKGWFTSFRSPTKSPAPELPSPAPVQLKPVPAQEDEEYVLASDVVRNRPPIITPGPKEMPREPPHRELVDLEHVPTPLPKSAAPRVPQRLVDLRPVSPPPPMPKQPVHIPRMRKDSGGSVKELVQSFEEMERREEMEARARKRSEQVLRVRNIGRLKNAKGKGKPVWRP